MGRKTDIKLSDAVGTEFVNRVASAIKDSGFSSLEPTDYESMTDEEIKMDVLTAAVVNPELFNTMRRVFISHAAPHRLDPHAARLRRIFMELDTNESHP